jgi:hypothetical protein
LKQIENVKEMEYMARKLSKSTISDLMARWGRKGGSRKTEAQKTAALTNLRKTPNFQKHAESQAAERVE